MEKVPDIKPIKLKEYNVKQSKYTSKVFESIV